MAAPIAWVSCRRERTWAYRLTRVSAASTRREWSNIFWLRVSPVKPANWAPSSDTFNLKSSEREDWNARSHTRVYCCAFAKFFPVIGWERLRT